ncbi:hypothetical protein [Smaragdicoccus niigatensis]|uniref:hypothetical protein n=1 Tax=Smaragdicoccus niigatensis TaxID=359359 RepID=UPI00035F81BA|nr:hypothetical protein [Smaragdicoccus niigatensis]
MSTTITTLTLSEIGKLPAHARRCVFWETDPSVERSPAVFDDPAFEKEAWLSKVMLEWGSCAQVSRNEYGATGAALYAPPSAVPRSAGFPTSPVSPDAVLLTSVVVEGCASGLGNPDYDGVAHQLVQAVAKDLIRRGVRALEAFGIKADPADYPTGPSATAALTCTPHQCMIPASFLEEAGFKTVAAHHEYPRLRLELDSDHEWKVDVEYALEQLLASASLTTTGSFRIP